MKLMNYRHSTATPLFGALIVSLCLVSAVAAFAADTTGSSAADQPVAASTVKGADAVMAGARSAFRRGAFGEASAGFAEAADGYNGSDERAKRCEALVMLAQASNFTGQYRKALEAADRSLTLAKELNDSRSVATALGTKGNSYLGIGDAERANQNLGEALVFAKEKGFEDVAAAILNNLGNLRASQKKYDEAVSLYSESATLAEISGDTGLAASALINGAKAAVNGGKHADATAMLAKGSELLRKGGESTAKAFNLISAGLIYNDLREQPGQSDAMMKQAFTAFSNALATTEKTGDNRTASYAYGYLGQLYEEDKQLDTAQELTRRAIFAAQQQGASEALYRWHWQNGRIFAKMGKLDDAIGSYRHAIRNLQSVREEMSSCYASPESSYQKSAGMVSSELVDLLLQRASKLNGGESAEPFLVEARETLEILKVFELREYFKDDCIDAARTVEKKLDTISGTTVVFYPILLKDRVELLVSFGGKLKRSTIPVDIAEFTKEIREFRRKLVKRTTWEFLPHAQKLYDWLIRPLEADLVAMKADTLVFVPDGALRTVPMSALHDGNQFLVNRYRIAITPSLNLTDPRPVNREHAKLLSVGITEAVQGFPGLPYVADELQAVRILYGGQLLLDKEFKLASLENELKKESYSMIHVATHGQFGGNGGETFILAFDEKFTMDRFGEYVGLFRFRDEPLDLLTLSACETAAGDDRAALGLAGVAVRAGARSALATLWHVNDPAAFELIAEFYTQLKNPANSRAAALQIAQQKLLNDLRYDHPGYWAPFLMINNWL